MISDLRGDVAGSPREPIGLFHRDMRHLSHWELRVDGRQLQEVHGEAVRRDEAVFFLVEQTPSVAVEPSFSLVRHRHVSDGMTETLRLTSHGQDPLSVRLSLLFDADFADVLEVESGGRKAGQRYQRLNGDRVVLGYQRESFQRESIIGSAADLMTPACLSFQVTLQPGETWQTEVVLSVGEGGGAAKTRRDQAEVDAQRVEWMADAPALESDDDHLCLTYHNSLADLAALRWETDSPPGRVIPAGGLPRFMALFGRDALITSYQALPFMPGLCRDVLRALATHQAAEFDDFTDAEPGKILHELRYGELAHFGERPQRPYYGAADTTPLFLIMLDEYERWTGDAQTIRELEGAARAALDWLAQYADRNGDGFIEYQTRNDEYGLPNQCWKDSPNSIVHPDGGLAELPRSTCEIQGYGYDARRRAARLARCYWDDPVLGERLERDAQSLRNSFVDAFWLPDEGFYAVALDGRGQPVRTLTSNIGHLLWSGIVPDEHVDSVVGHLMGERLFSGWGIRTIAVGQSVYNPTGYHTGTVWPHDSAIVAQGLARYGRRQSAVELSEAGLTAAAYQRHRLPEALVGIGRDVIQVPMDLPEAAWPHAWSCGAPLLYLRALIGLEPGPDGPTLAPRLAHEQFTDLTLRGLRGRWGCADVVRAQAPESGRSETRWPAEVAEDEEA